MTPEEFANLHIGDIVTRYDNDFAYVVTGNYDNHITVVRTVDITNRTEWIIRYKAKHTTIKAV